MKADEQIQNAKALLKSKRDVLPRMLVKSLDAIIASRGGTVALFGGGPKRAATEAGDVDGEGLAAAAAATQRRLSNSSGTAPRAQRQRTA